MVAAARSLQPSNLRALALSRWTITVATVGVVGIALRVWIYDSLLSRPNSDEAIVGLMVKHATQGDIPVFFWGSAYGGPQEVLASVPVFAVFGVNYHALRVVPILLTALAAVLLWRVGRRTIGEPAAAFAGCLFWIWPPFNLFQLTQHQSFYAANVFYCALLLLLTLRVVEQPDRTRVGVFGLVVGLAFWQTGQIVPVAVPMIAWIVWKAPRALRHLWLGAGAALVGASPWIVWNATHGWASLSVHSSLENYRHSLRLLASPVLPMTLGLRSPFGQQWFLPSAPLMYLIYVALLALAVYGAYRTRHRTTSLLYLVAAVFPFLYAVDRRTSFISGWPQYTVVVTPVLALLLAQLATRYWRGVALLALGAAMSIVSVPRMQEWYERPQPIPYPPSDFSPLISTLDSLGLDRVYTDYWIAYRLTFATDERIIGVENEFRTVAFRDGQAVLPKATNPPARYRPYERDVASSRHGFVFFQRTAPAEIVRPLEQHGYTRHPVDNLVVYAPPAATD